MVYGTRITPFLHPSFLEGFALTSSNMDHLAILCHEIRTPLNAVVGLANTIAKLNASPEKQKQCLDMLNDSSRMLTELLEELLAAFRSGTLKVQQTHKVFDLSRLLEEAKNIVVSKADEKGLRLHIRIGSGFPAFFIGDPLRISQILVNLLGNAIKFTTGGTISLYVSEKPLAEGYQEVRITVADEGIGIGKENLEKIFDKYTQADSQVGKKYGGTGLGLFISQELAHLMGGEISVRSWAGRGSHFTLTLPLQKFGASPDPEEEKEPVPTPREFPHC